MHRESVTSSGPPISQQRGCKNDALHELVRLCTSIRLPPVHILYQIIKDQFETQTTIRGLGEYLGHRDVVHQRWTGRC